MGSAYITGLGVFLPNAPVDNDNIENVLGVINGKPSRIKPRILKNNGIKTRYYAIDSATGKQTHTNAQLTTEAIHELIKNTKFSLEEIECLVCGTSVPDQMIPNHALMVHGELGSLPCEVVSTSGVCCAGITAFKYGYMSVLSGLTKNALTTGSELVSNGLRAAYFQPEIEAKIQEFDANPVIGFEKDFLRWMLSDAAAAVLITDVPREDGISLKIDWVDYISYANELETCMYGGCIKRTDGSVQGWRDVDDPEKVWKDGYFYIKQDVQLLGKHIVDYGVDKYFPEVLAKYHLKPDEIDWFLPHYSSEYFKTPVYDAFVKLGFPIPFDKWFTNLTSKGNTGSASIFVMLEELMYSGKLRKGEKILCLIPESARFSYAYMQLTVV